MKTFTITAISDTHNHHKKISKLLPGGDILIHSGDFTSIGRKHEVENFIDWFGKQPYLYKVFIAGNHDLVFDREILYREKSAYFEGLSFDTPLSNGKPDWLKKLLSELPDGTFYLENTNVVIDGIKIWGSPYTPSFGVGWAFNLPRGYPLNQLWKEIPEDTDILVTHTPIYGHNDRTLNTNTNAGCSDLYFRLMNINPCLHIHGHIHEGYGATIMKKADSNIETINASICTLSRDGVNNPIHFNCNFETRTINYLT
jgi:Icc-related predicted phosphoesterase